MHMGLEGARNGMGDKEKSQRQKVNEHDLQKGMSEGEVGSGRNSRLLSPTASRDKLSGTFFFFLHARVNAGRDFTDLQEVSAGLNTTSPKSVCV